MTLAVILLVGISSTAFPPPLLAGTANQSPSQSTPPASSSAPNAQDQGAASPQPPANSQSSATVPAAKPPAAGKPSATKKPHHKKKAVVANCVAMPSSDSSGTPSGGSTEAGTTATPASSSVQTNCPPTKTVVHRGGTAEPSIQLAGGTGGDEASRKRDAVTRVLGTAEANLKKMVGRQLSTAEQDTVTQVRQFMKRSQDAIESGNLERAQTLAWKAQTLSEDLIKAQN